MKLKSADFDKESVLAAEIGPRPANRHVEMTEGKIRQRRLFSRK